MHLNNLKKIKFQKAYRFLAMKRSGHHAIINWIAENTEANIYFANNFTRESTVEIIKTGYSKNVLFYNLEDYDFIKDKNIFLKKGEQPEETILILRDPLNLFASRIKVSERSNYPHWFDEYSISIFKQHHNVKDKLLTIDYPKWITNKDYKLEIAAKMNLKGAGYSGATSIYGGGSSFTKMTTKITADAVLSRWKNLTKQQIELIKEQVDIAQYEKYYQ